MNRFAGAVGAMLVASVWSSNASAALVTVGIGAFAGDTVLTFESLAEDELVNTQFSALGVTFNDIKTEPHADYGPDFAAAVLACCGAQALGQNFRDGAPPDVVTFTTPVTRVGFDLGSNVNIAVPLEVYRGATLLGSFSLIVTADNMNFFGFEDLAGIDRLVFGFEPGSSVSQVDNLRFGSGGVVDPDPVPVPASALLLGAGLAALAGLRRAR